MLQAAYYGKGRLCCAGVLKVRSCADFNVNCQTKGNAANRKAFDNTAELV